MRDGTVVTLDNIKPLSFISPIFISKGLRLEIWRIGARPLSGSSPSAITRSPASSSWEGRGSRIAADSGNSALFSEMRRALPYLLCASCRSMLPEHMHTRPTWKASVCGACSRLCHAFNDDKRFYISSLESFEARACTL